MHPDLAIRRLAGTQLLLITRAQLRELGLTPDQIRHRTRTGSLLALHHGVYLTSGDRPTFEQCALAANMACGAGAIVSGLTAAGVWGFTEPNPSVIDVTVPSHRRPHVERVRLHRTALKPVIDRTIRGAIPITTPARTLLDGARLVGSHELERIADEAFRRSTPTPARLCDYLARPDLKRCRGIATLRTIALERARHGVPESQLEADAIRLLRRYGLPEPVRQFPTRASGRNVRFDLAYPDKRVAIELKGRAPHWGRDAWQSDHDRHNAIELTDWRVLEFTWSDIHDRPLYVVLTVAEALGLRPRAWKATHEDSKVSAK